MIVYYFGADGPLATINGNGIRRRNMAILDAITRQPSVDSVFNIIRSTRQVIFKNLRKDSQTNSKVVTIYIAPILPERGSLGRFTRPINRWILKKIYPKAFRSTHSSNQLAWCYWPKGFEDFEYLGLDMDVIFDTDHNIIDDPNNTADFKLNRKELLLRIGARATYILSSSRSMLKWYQQHGFENTRIVMNGVFEKRINLSSSPRENSVYTVTYCGTLSKWIKIDWLFQVINDHPDWHFNFIGSNYKTDLDVQLKLFSNVQLWGFLDPKEVDRILKESDVCIGLYQEDGALDVNSMKLYDYLAQGIPVVVNNYHPHLSSDFNGLLNIAATYQDFNLLLEHPKKPDLDTLKQFLNNSTWDRRVEKILHEVTA